MVQYTSLYNEHYNPNCVTGDQDYLYDRLKESITRAWKIDIIVAFLMESGVRLLVDDLKDAVKRGAAIRILCGNYLNITQPQALYLLKDTLEDQVDLRFYNVPGRSFHPKSYIFEYENDGDIFVGSSNISRSALTHGIEWNYRINAKTNKGDYEHFRKTFNDLFLNHSIIVDDTEMERYSKSWKKPKVFEDLEKLEDAGQEDSPKTLRNAAEPSDAYRIIEFYAPIGPQIEALYKLKKFRLGGGDKGIVVAATGVGKTFLAAFDSRGYKKVLFVAHREEILTQAERTFHCVRPDDSTGYFIGDRKEKDCDILFATVQTLGRQEYLNDAYFKPDTFDYIVIDEFHHAVAESYRKIISYFNPKFILGLTATPERLDNQDVFALLDYNQVYEARLREAINKGWLVPFRYYGVYDKTNYDNIAYKNGRYDEKQLELALNEGERADLVLQHYQKYSSFRALGFCASRGHAAYMAEYFCKHGIKSCAVISGNIPENSKGSESAPYISERTEALSKLRSAEIRIIFSVDIFNEGLDVPEVDMVMFLRPTESPTVFLQQLGRGLRKKGIKKYVNVLDFVGNYKKAIYIPFFLSGYVKDIGIRTKTIPLPGEDDYPDGCIVDFDLRLIDLFKRIAEKQKDAFEKLKDEYFRIKETLGTRPLRVDMYTYMDEGIYAAIRSRKELNIFRDYISFLQKIGELTEDEQTLPSTMAHAFLTELESTNMSKTYKMPLLLAFYNNGDMKLSITEDEIYESFKYFYSRGSNAVDMMKDKSTRNYRGWGKKEYVSLARRNPMHFLMQSAPNYFYEEGNNFCLNPALAEFINHPAFITHFKDVIDYRTRKFYRERFEHRVEDNK